MGSRRLRWFGSARRKREGARGWRQRREHEGHLGVARATVRWRPTVGKKGDDDGMLWGRRKSEKGGEWERRTRDTR